MRNKEYKFCFFTRIELTTSALAGVRRYLLYVMTIYTDLYICGDACGQPTIPAATSDA